MIVARQLRTGSRSSALGQSPGREGVLPAILRSEWAHDSGNMSLGARLLKPADDIESTDGFQVYADPAGHPFCLCWG